MVVDFRYDAGHNSGPPKQLNLHSLRQVAPTPPDRDQAPPVEAMPLSPAAESLRDQQRPLKGKICCSLFILSVLLSLAIGCIATLVSIWYFAGFPSAMRAPANLEQLPTLTIANSTLVNLRGTQVGFFANVPANSAAFFYIPLPRQCASTQTCAVELKLEVSSGTPKLFATLGGTLAAGPDRAHMFVFLAEPARLLSGINMRRSLSEVSQVTRLSLAMVDACDADISRFGVCPLHITISSTLWNATKATVSMSFDVLSSASPSLSLSSSSTTSPSRSVSDTSSVSLSPSLTRSVSLSPTPTPSVSLSPTPTPSVSLSPTPTPSVSLSSTPTPSVSLSPSPTPTVSLSASQTSTISLSSSPTPSKSFSSSVSPSPTASLCLLFDYTGAYQFVTVPAGAKRIQVTLWGGGGGMSSASSSRGGAGAYLTGTLTTSVVPGSRLRIIIGCGACPGGLDVRGGGGLSTLTWGGEALGNGGGRTAVQMCFADICNSDTAATSITGWMDIVTAGGGGAGGGEVLFGGFASWFASARGFDCRPDTSVSDCSGGAGLATRPGDSKTGNGYFLHGGNGDTGGGGGYWGGGAGGTPTLDGVPCCLCWNNRAGSGGGGSSLIENLKDALGEDPPSCGSSYSPGGTGDRFYVSPVARGARTSFPAGHGRAVVCFSF